MSLSRGIPVNVYEKIAHCAATMHTSSIRSHFLWVWAFLVASCLAGWSAAIHLSYGFGAFRVRRFHHVSPPILYQQFAILWPPPASVL